MNIVVQQVVDIGVSRYEPQQFVYDSPEENLLGGEQGEAVGEIVAALVAEYALGAHARAVVLYHPVFADVPHHVEILFHNVSNAQIIACSKVSPGCRRVEG